MYSYTRAIAIEPGVNQKWKPVDISTIPTKVLLSIYKQVYVVLTEASILGEMTLNLDDVSEELQVNTGTISNYLFDNGNKTLPTVMGSPVVTKNDAIFADAFSAGFHVDTTDYKVGEGVMLPDDLQHDLIVRPVKEPEDYDYLGLRQRVVANVNGFYHNTAANSKGYFVLEGNKSARMAKKNHLGLLSFGTMGAFENHPITEDMLSFEKDPVSSRVDKVHIRFSSNVMCSKTPILFLGGYLLTIDEKDLFVSGDNILTFKTLRYPLVDRYYDSHDSISFEDFNIPHSNDNPDLTQFHYFYTEAYLRKYFTMSQSFLICVDAVGVLSERIYPDVETVPHTYQCYTKPKYPLVVSYGKHEVYWPQEEAGQWVINCRDAYRKNYMYHTVPSGRLVNVDDTLFPGDAGYYSPAYFLKLSKEKVEIRLV